MMEATMETLEEEGPLGEITRTHITQEETEDKVVHSMVGIITATLVGEEDHIIVEINILEMIALIIILVLTLDQRCRSYSSVLC